MRVLQVGAEVFPIVKTGGLADVLGALPQALAERGADVRLLLPGLPAIVDALLHAKTVAEFGPLFGAARVRLVAGQMPYSHVGVYVIDAPYLYHRDGGPYQSSDGTEWPDNLQRFGLLGWIAAHLAAGDIDATWRPEVLHAHDWHAATSFAYIAQHPPSAALATVFTVHNLAFQGLFPPGDLQLLGLSSRLMTPAALEFHHQLSFMKAGLKFADRITTVSPTYAREMTTAEFGCGLDGVIRGRGAHVSGILNGIDREVWNPERDSALAARYSAEVPQGKGECKAALQAEFGLPRSPAPLFAVLSRLASQKGLDLLLAALPALLRTGAQLVVQGTGEPALERAWRDAAQASAGRIGVRIAYDEARAHRIVAGADSIVVPSRFEPCGLTQLYGLRYGTLPLVRRVGGLADTVVDASEAALRDDTATGFVLDAATPAAVEQALLRAVALYGEGARWARVMRRAMAQEFSWRQAAERYMALYATALQAKAAAAGA